MILYEIAKSRTILRTSKLAVFVIKSTFLTSLVPLKQDFSQKHGAQAAILVSRGGGRRAAVTAVLLASLSRDMRRRRGSTPPLILPKQQEHPLCALPRTQQTAAWPPGAPRASFPSGKVEHRGANVLSNEHALRRKSSRLIGWWKGVRLFYSERRRRGVSPRR